MRNKILLLSVISVLSFMPVCAEELSDVIYPKSPSYRVGISELPEQQYVQAQVEKVKAEKRYVQLNNTSEGSIADRTYADLSIKNLSREISQDLEFDEQDMLADLSLLWQGAAKQSDTINFALYKLANPDADKPDEKSIKKVLTTIASMSTLVGAGVGSPVLAGSSLIGGNILRIMSQDTKALNYKYTHVNDADMIILIRKVEDLQQTTINLYYDYLSSKKQYEYTTKLVEDRQHKFELAQKNNAARELIVITDAYYRTALDKQRAAKSEFFAKRAALEQFVGNETFVQFESELTSRENGENIKTVSNSDNNYSLEDTEEYQDTIQTVETYKNNLTQQVIEPIMSEDENLVKVPVLRPLDEESPQEMITGSSSSIEVDIDETNIEKSSKRALKKAEKQARKQNKLDVKKAKKELKIQNKIDKKSKKLNEELINETNKTKVKKESKKTKNVLTEEEQRALERAKAKKKDPTMGLIFLHGQDKSQLPKRVQTPATELNQAVPVVNSTQPSGYGEILPAVPMYNTQRPTPADLMGLPPLDDIRVPDLSTGGYSIHSESNGEINSADLYVRY